MQNLALASRYETCAFLRVAYILKESADVLSRPELAIRKGSSPAIAAARQESQPYRYARPADLKLAVTPMTICFSNALIRRARTT